MNATLKIAVLGLSLVGAVAPAVAQPYGYGGGGYDRGDYGDRGPRYRDRDRDYDRGRGYGRGGGGYGFDAAEYLRCNPDVRRAVRNGQMQSAEFHWRNFGRREGRRLSC